MNFKKSFIFGLGLIMAVTILAPAFSSAENSAGQGATVCLKISEAYSKIAQAIAQREGKVLAKKLDLSEKIEDHWLHQDKNLADKRKKWDANRTQQIAKLNEKFSDDAQKQAVIRFEQAVNIAISARRAAIDSAISTFRQGVQQIKSSRQAKFDSAKTAFKNSVVAAFDKAKADCQAGVALVTIRENLKNSISVAKETYQKEVANIESLGAGMEQLIADRKAAFEKAIQDFKAAMDKARADFKAATAQQTDPDQSLKIACESSGGTVATSTCCKSAKNYPNLCLIGACGCSPDNSKETKICICETAKCFNGSTCVPAIMN